MITIIVKGRMAKRAGHEELVTSGSVKMKLRFEFDSAWDGLSRLATFKGADDIDVLLDENNSCDIPWEAVETSGKPLMVGVYGTNSDGVVIPTIYCNVGMIRTGAEPSETTSQEATPTAVQQMLTAATTCTTKASSAASSASAAEYSSQVAVTRSNTAITTASTASETAAAADAKAAQAKSTAEAAQAAVASKQDKLTAGTNITIVDNVISATGGGGGGGSTAWADITGKPETFPPSAHEHTVSQISDFPSIPTDTNELTNGAGYITASYHDSSKQDVISDLDTIRNGAAAGATAVQPESGKGLFSGSYPDLTNKPTLAVELDIERNPDNLTVGYLRNTGTVNTNAPTNRMIVVDVSQLPSVGFSGVTTSTSVYDYYGFSTAETIEAAIADASTVTAVDISQNNAAAIPVPSTAKLFILSVNTADLAVVKVFKNLPIGTDGINAMIDAKIGTLETLSASVLELIGDEVTS